MFPISPASEKWAIVVQVGPCLSRQLLRIPFFCSVLSFFWAWSYRTSALLTSFCATGHLSRLPPLDVQNVFSFSFSRAPPPPPRGFRRSETNHHIVTQDRIINHVAPSPSPSPSPSSNSTTLARASLVTLSASSTTAVGIARLVVVFWCKLLASPGPGPAAPFAFLPLPPPPPPPPPLTTCTVEEDEAAVASPPLLLLLPLVPVPAPVPAAAVAAEEEEDVSGRGSRAVSLRTSSRICRRSAGNEVASPLRRSWRARFWTRVGQLFGCALRA